MIICMATTTYTNEVLMGLVHIETSARVPVGERSLVQRINRRLAKDHQKLFMSRSRAAEAEFGKFYIVGTATGEVTASMT